MKIAIIGAGPAGLACAWQLAKSGHTIVVIERMNDLTVQGSGVLLQPIGLVALEIMGVRQEVEALGHRIEQINGTTIPSGWATVSVDYRVLRKNNYAYGINRTALWNILYKKASESGVKVLENINIESFVEEQDESVTLLDENGKRYEGYDCIVDASGARSKLNRYAERAAESRLLDYGSLWAKVALPKDSPFNQNKMILYSDRQNRGIGIMPIGKKTLESAEMATLFFNLSWRNCPNWDDKIFLEWQKEMIEKWPKAAHLIEQITSHEQIYLAKFHQHTLPMPYGKKIVFIGDAAHAAAPQLGLGVNMSLIDALVLSRVMEQQEDLQTAFSRYAKSRFKHVVFYQTLARAMIPFYQSDIRSAIILREYLYGVIAKLLMMKSITAFLISGQLFNPLKLVYKHDRKKCRKKNSHVSN